MPRKSISFTVSHDAWIKAQVASGEYTSDSEVIRDLIRSRKKHDEQLDALQARLRAAEDLGMSEASPESVRQKAKARLKSDVKV